MFKPRATIIFDLTFIKSEAGAKNSSAHALIINFYKIVNTHSHAIFSFNTFLLFTIRRKRRDENKNYRNNNNNENKREKSDNDKSKRSDENNKNDKN